MKRIGIIICARYQDCGGGKCFRAVRERVGGVSESQYGLPVVIGTHPIPLKYLEAHNQLSFWDKMNMKELAGDLMMEDPSIMEAYN
jgi:hypothetical protein